MAQQIEIESEAERKAKFRSVFGDKRELQPFSPFRNTQVDLALVTIDDEIPYAMFVPRIHMGSLRVGCFVEYVIDQTGNPVRRLRLYDDKRRLQIGVINHRINGQTRARWTALPGELIDLQILADETDDTAPAIAQFQYSPVPLVPVSADIALGSIDELKKQGDSPLNLLGSNLLPNQPVQAVSLQKKIDGDRFSYSVHDCSIEGGSLLGMVGNYEIVEREDSSLQIAVMLENRHFVVRRSYLSELGREDWEFELPFVPLDKFEAILKGPARDSFGNQLLSRLSEIYPIDFRNQNAA